MTGKQIETSINHWQTNGNSQKQLTYKKKWKETNTKVNKLNIEQRLN